MRLTNNQLTVCKKHTRERGKELIDAVMEWGSATRAAKEIGCSRQNINIIIRRAANKAAAAGDLDTASNQRATAVAKTKRWVITSAQNDTEVHGAFCETLGRFADHVDAKPIAIMTRYANPDKFHRGADAALEWDHALDGWYLDKDVSLGPNLMIAGDCKIAGTSANPLAGLDLLGRGKSMIVGHAQMQMRLVATPHGVAPKMLHSTGACTLPNFSRSVSGRKAREHYNLGALYVEMRGDSFYVFQIEAAKDGSFYFLDEYFTVDGITTGHRPLAYIIGDEHEIHLTDAEKESLWGPAGPIQTLDPECLVRHDVCDFFIRNHHHEGDHCLNIFKELAGYTKVETELRATASYLNETSQGRVSYIVDSNHPNAFGRWLNRFKPAQDISNADFYHRFMGSVAHSNAYAGDKFTHFMTQFLPEDQRTQDNVRYLTRNDKLAFAGIDCSQHGDKGANGARGSANSFAKAMNKMVFGHSHSPKIEKGAWGVGTWAMAMTKGYASGISSWMVMDVVIYRDGARSMVTHINGRWRA